MFKFKWRSERSETQLMIAFNTVRSPSRTCVVMVYCQRCTELTIPYAGTLHYVIQNSVTNWKTSVSLTEWELNSIWLDKIMHYSRDVVIDKLLFISSLWFDLCLTTVLPFCAVLYCTILYYLVLYCTVLYYTVLSSIVLHCTVLCQNVQELSMLVVRCRHGTWCILSGCQFH